MARAFISNHNVFDLVLGVMLAAGCAGGITATVADDGPPPEMVYAAPGVQVIADYDEPIFYSDNFYWRFSSGRWYRSSYYRRGWVSAAPPPAVIRIDRPNQYSHYRPAGWAPRSNSMRGAPPAGRYESRRPEPAAPRPAYQSPARAAASQPAPAGAMRGTPPAAPNRGHHDDHEHHDREHHDRDHH